MTAPIDYQSMPMGALVEALDTEEQRVVGFATKLNEAQDNVNQIRQALSVRLGLAPKARTDNSVMRQQKVLKQANEGTLEKRIVAFFNTVPQATIKEIGEHFHKNDRHMHSTLSKLSVAGQIRRVSIGIYARAEPQPKNGEPF